MTFVAIFPTFTPLERNMGLFESFIYNAQRSRADLGAGVPERGVVLVVTDERGCEACFGFFKFPERILDIHGNILAETDFGKDWVFRDFVYTPDPRYREIVRKFADAGYVAVENDEYM